MAKKALFLEDTPVLLPFPLTFSLLPIVLFCAHIWAINAFSLQRVCFLKWLWLDRIQNWQRLWWHNAHRTNLAPGWWTCCFVVRSRARRCYAGIWVCQRQAESSSRALWSRVGPSHPTFSHGKHLFRVPGWIFSCARQELLPPGPLGWKPGFPFTSFLSFTKKHHPREICSCWPLILDRKTCIPLGKYIGF